jgi:transketolase
MEARDGVSPVECRSLSSRLRRWIVEQSFESGVGHIGSALSIVDIMAVLWEHVLHEPGSDDPERDRFILAKGHAALALYGVLRAQGLISDKKFHTYCQDDSQLGVHPEGGLPGIEVATGSLGQGLSVACGIAYALRLRGSAARVFVLVSDAECNEGQLWEAVMFAAHHRLTNLIAIVDGNGMQAMGPTADVLNLAPLAPRWQAFGWQIQEVNGHDEAELRRAFTSGIANRTGPAVVLARTVLGKGVSFMESRVEWHYRNLSAELAGAALQELEA